MTGRCGRRTPQFYSYKPQALMQKVQKAYSIYSYESPEMACEKDQSAFQ